MSSSSDEFNPKRRKDADAPYKVGNKNPPRHRQYRPGQSGNPKGRPKGRSDFGKTLMKEFTKPVQAIKNGKPVKITNDKIFAASLVKDGITKGPQAKALLAKFILEQEAREAAQAEARKKADAFGPVKEFSWGEEQEKLYQQLERAVKRRLEDRSEEE